MNSPLPPSIPSTLPIVLGLIALAGAPLSSWLFIQRYTDNTIAKAIAQHDREITRTIVQLERNQAFSVESTERIRDYVINLCTGIRASVPSFECGSTYVRGQYHYSYTPGTFTAIDSSHPYPYRR